MAIPGEREDTFLVLTKEENNMLLGLEKLGLIKYQEFDTEREKIKGEEYIYVKQYGVLLTKFGHSFVDCLEHPTK
jgi:predicted transcriptional regulator of viral defense system